MAGARDSRSKPSSGLAGSVAVDADGALSETGLEARLGREGWREFMPDYTRRSGIWPPARRIPSPLSGCGVRWHGPPSDLGLRLRRRSAALYR